MWPPNAVRSGLVDIYPWLPIAHVVALGSVLVWPSLGIAGPSTVGATSALAAVEALLDLLVELIPGLFAPLPLWVVGAVLVGTRRARVASALPWLLFIGIYGADVLPPLSRPAVDTAGTIPLRVMTFNIMWDNRSVDRAVDLIRDVQPDVLFVQELEVEHLAALGALDGELPYHAPRPRRGVRGVGLWSRYPILAEEAWTATPRTPTWQYAQIAVGQFRVHLVNLHLTAPDPILRDPRRWPFLPIIGVVPRPRAEEAELAATRLRELVATGEPTVAAGDLNMTEQTADYRRLRGAGLGDAQRAVGRGFGFTFPTGPMIELLGVPVPLGPILRLDHVLYAAARVRGIEARPEWTGSDHLPVVVDLELGDPPDRATTLARSPGA